MPLVSVWSMWQCAQVCRHQQQSAAGPIRRSTNAGHGITNAGRTSPSRRQAPLGGTHLNRFSGHLGGHDSEEHTEPELPTIAPGERAAGHAVGWRMYVAPTRNLALPVAGSTPSLLPHPQCPPRARSTGRPPSLWNSGGRRHARARWARRAPPHGRLAPTSRSLNAVGAGVGAPLTPQRSRITPVERALPPVRHLAPASAPRAPCAAARSTLGARAARSTRHQPRAR